MKDVLIDTLGLCEHCGTVFTVEDLPVEALDAEWRCSECNGILAGKSLSFEGNGKKVERTKWVGPDRKWTDIRPNKEFTLGSWHVLVGTPYPRVY